MRGLKTILAVLAILAAWPAYAADKWPNGCPKSVCLPPEPARETPFNACMRANICLDAPGDPLGTCAWEVCKAQYSEAKP